MPVTVNPAIQLGIEKIAARSEAGKDADTSSGRATRSTFSLLETTWIDGARVLSLAKDRETRCRDADLRDRLIQRILTENARKPAGEEGRRRREEGPTQARTRLDQRTLDLLRETYLEIIRAGGDPTAHRCGECGVLDLHAGHIH